MAPPLLTLQDVCLSFGGEPLLVGADFSLGPQDRLCLVGRNGCGKSSLLKIAAGLLEADDGVRFMQPGLQIGVLEQEPDFSGYETVADYVMEGRSGDEFYLAAPLLDALKLDGGLETASLSGGQGRRAALVKVLSFQPDVLFLDEPTNHLDLPAIEWLEAWLRASGAALCVISHDRRFLERVSNKVLWIDRGTTRVLHEGFSGFEAWRDEVFQQEETDAHKRARKIAMEEDWLRYGVTARRKRNQKRLAQLHQLRADHKAHQGPLGKVEMKACEGPVSGKLVVEAETIRKAYGGPPLIKDLSLRVQRGDRLGIVGPNGAGKTTLVNLLSGVIEPDEGSIKRGANLETVHLDQGRAGLKPGWTLQDALTNGGGEMVDVAGTSKHVVGYMKDFLFQPAQARTPLDVLSGGERARVMLARALSLPSNLMILDEPTNDLDLETLDLLEEMLSAYEGTVLLVSHDRDFLDRVVNSVLLCHGEGQWVHYAGGYSQAKTAYEASLSEAAGLLKQKTSVSQSQEGAVVSADEAAPRKPRSQRLSYKDKYALETLPGEMEALEGEIAALQARLDDPALFEKDPDVFHRTTERLTAALQELEAAQDQWLALEIKREEMEGEG